MTLQDKIKLAIEQGKIVGAKKLASELIATNHKAKWLEEKQAEYDLLYPEYRNMTDEEYIAYQDELYGDGAEPILPIPQDETKVKIDYSSDETYVTFSDWLNETKLVSEVVYYTYEEYVANEQAKYEGIEDIPLLDEDEYNLLPSVKTPEVTELVRLYIALEITDEMVEDKLEEYSAYAEYKDILKTEAKESIVVEHNTVKYDGDPMSINFMSAVGAVGAMRMFQLLVQSGIIPQEQYDMVYKTTESWKGSDNTIHQVQIESVVEACELAMQEQAKVIGAK